MLADDDKGRRCSQHTLVIPTDPSCADICWSAAAIKLPFISAPRLLSSTPPINTCEHMQWLSSRPSISSLYMAINYNYTPNFATCEWTTFVKSIFSYLYILIIVFIQCFFNIYICAYIYLNIRIWRASFAWFCLIYISSVNDDRWIN